MNDWPNVMMVEVLFMIVVGSACMGAKSMVRVTGSKTGDTPMAVTFRMRAVCENWWTCGGHAATLADIHCDIDHIRADPRRYHKRLTIVCGDCVIGHSAYNGHMHINRGLDCVTCLELCLAATQLASR